MEKYSRQLKFLNNFLPLEENLEEFQKVISNKKIIIVGCGGIGSPLCELLIRGGFLNLTIIDNEIIDKTNIQRQIFFESDIGSLKTNALKRYLLKINQNAKINAYNEILDNENIEDICEKQDLIIDCTDNFQTRILINQFCEKHQKNWIYTGAVKSEIIGCVFIGKNKKFKKVFPKPIINESCCEVGVLGSTTFTSASLAYNLTLKYFLGINENKLIKMNLWSNKIFEVKL